MGWLRKLFGGEAVEAPSPPARLRREPLTITGEPTNPVQALLDDIGAPWRLPRVDLEARFGVSVDPAYGWEVIELRTTRPLVEGLIRPLTAQTGDDVSPVLPSTWLSAQTWYGSDARENLRRTAEQLEPLLGPAHIGQQADSVHCEWRFGAAAIALNAWPKDLREGAAYEVPAHAIEPRLADACSITIEPGFRPALSEIELSWLETLRPLATLPSGLGDRVEDLFENAPSGAELVFVREPPADVARLFRGIWTTPGGEALILCQQQLYVVPTAELISFRLDRILPAKGGGWSRLEAEVVVDSEQTTTIGVAQAAGADDLTALGEQLAEALDRPLTISPYEYDC